MQDVQMEGGAENSAVPQDTYDSESEDDIPIGQWRSRAEPEPREAPRRVSMGIQATSQSRSLGPNVAYGLPRRTKEQTLGNQVSKLKVLLPLFKGLDIKPNLRHLFLR